MFLAGRALIPAETVADWKREAAKSGSDHEEMASADHTAGHEMNGAGQPDVKGLSLEQDGYRLGPVSAPLTTDVDGRLSFRIIGPDGKPLEDYSTSHEKDLHLIVVRSDGAGFRHVHPQLESGTWSIPWAWQRGGSYRVFADFVPADSPNSAGVTVGRTVDVGGRVEPESKTITRRDYVGGFEVSVDGNLKAGHGSSLTFTVTRNDSPETGLQPYLGALGHLVVLREGDLAFLHAHPEESHSSGPEIEFETTAPTPGRYLLYLDFKVDHVVRSAKFVLEAK